MSSSGCRLAAIAWQRRTAVLLLQLDRGRQVAMASSGLGGRHYAALRAPRQRSTSARSGRARRADSTRAGTAFCLSDAPFDLRHFYRDVARCYRREPPDGCTGRRPKLDSNSPDSSIRGSKLNRQSALFAGSVAGAENWAFIVSPPESCELCDANWHAWLTDTLVKLVKHGLHPHNEASAVLGLSQRPVQL